MKSKVSPEELTGKEMIRRKTQQVKVKDFRGGQHRGEFGTKDAVALQFAST
jgi:hypothetical protein